VHSWSQLARKYWEPEASAAGAVAAGSVPAPRDVRNSHKNPAQSERKTACSLVDVPDSQGLRRKFGALTIVSGSQLTRAINGRIIFLSLTEATRRAPRPTKKGGLW